ncbi:hypothetical protein V1506DRAFT_527542 [Lipomyces tetrasporus]
MKIYCIYCVVALVLMETNPSLSNLASSMSHLFKFSKPAIAPSRSPLGFSWLHLNFPDIDEISTSILSQEIDVPVRSIGCLPRLGPV